MTKIRGEFVKIQGKNLHIQRMGSGGKTIVLMPGWGVPLPTADFAPLMRDLSQKHTVCTIEFFGYGLSDSTDRPHTNESYVQEIREALKLVGLQPPYVLMPHSAAGIYCEYYAIQYPQEVAALVLLDTSPTVAGFVEKLVLPEKELAALSAHKSSKFGLGLNKRLVKMILRIRGEKQAHIQAGYTKDEVIELSTTPNHMGTLVAQMRALPDNLRELLALETKLDLPILLLSSGQMKADVEHQTYLTEYLQKLGEHTRHVFVDGSTHIDIYWRRDSRKIVCQEVDAFLEALD